MSIILVTVPCRSWLHLPPEQLGPRQGSTPDELAYGATLYKL